MIKPRLNVDFPAAKRRMFIKANNEYSPNSNEFLFNHNRSALLFILNLLNITGKNVAVMVYNCHTVMNAIHQAGGHPIFIDVDKSLKMDIADLKRKSNKVKIDAVIVTHLFGVPNDIAAIRNILDVPIIEDCAHAYLSPGCGEKGDFAVYSTGQGKFPSIGDGGICIVNNLQYKDKFAEVYSGIPNYSIRERISLFLRMIAKDFCYNPFIYYILKTLNFTNRANAIENISIRKMDKGISSLYNEGIQELNINRNNRQNNAEKIISILSSIDAIPLINPKDTNCFMLPVNCKEPTIVMEYFRNKGIETATHFKQCTVWARTFGYQDGNCPNAEYFTKHLLLVPTYRYDV